MAHVRRGGTTALTVEMDCKPLEGEKELTGASAVQSLLALLGSTNLS